MSDSHSEPAAQPGRGVSALDAEQAVAFAAFRRPVGDDDRALLTDGHAMRLLGDAQAGAEANPSLARCVYAGSEGRIYLVPGAGALCCIALHASGEASVGTTTTTLATQDGHGFVRSGPSRAQSGPSLVATFVGVLPDGGRDLRIIDRSGNAVAVPLSPDDGYWITVNEPVDMCWTKRDGTVRQMPFGRYGMARVLFD